MNCLWTKTLHPSTSLVASPKLALLTIAIDSICQGSELSLSIWCRIFNAEFVLGTGSAVINLEINSNKERAATLSIQEVCCQQWPSIETSCQASKLHQFKLYRPTELLKKLIYTQIRDFSNMTPDQFPKFTEIQKSFQVQILCQLVESENRSYFPWLLLQSQQCDLLQSCTAAVAFVQVMCY